MRRTCLTALILTSLLSPVALRADQIWIEAFTAMQSGEKPQGYRYDVNVNPIDIQVFFQNDTSGTNVTDNRVFINGSGTDVAFSCSYDDATGAGSCFATLPYNCGKVTFVVQQQRVSFPSLITSTPVDIFVFNSPACLPQCDSCQLGSTGQAAGRPVNVATGKLWYRTTDVAISGPLGLRFSRWYDNQAQNTGDLGIGWRHNLSSSLDLSQNAQGSITFHDEEDRRSYFTGLVANGSVHDFLSGSDLALNSGGTTYTLTTWGGSKYTFDSAGRLSTLADRIGNTQTIARDASHRISTVTDPLSRVFTFHYDASNRVTSITSNVTQLPATVLSMVYDTGTNCSTGNLCSVTEPDSRVWTYQYDGSHQLTQAVDPNGNAQEINTYSGGKCATQSVQGSLENLTFTYPSNGTTTVTDGLSRTTTYNYDPKLLLVTTVSGGPGCSCGGGQSRSYTWDPFLRKTSETDGDGATHQVTWGYGRDVTACFFDNFCDVVQAFPSPTAKTEPLSSGVSRTMTWTYPPGTDTGTPTRDLPITESVPSADTSGNTKVTTNTWSTQGLLMEQSVQGYIGGVSTTYITDWNYDSRGRLLSVDGPRNDTSDRTAYVYFGDGDLDFARRGQLNTVTDAVGNVTVYADTMQSAPYNTYDAYGHARSVTDPNKAVRQMDYDNRGRLTLSRLKGVTGDATDLVTTYTYDNAGRLTKVSLPAGNGTSYGYEPVTA